MKTFSLRNFNIGKETIWSMLVSSALYNSKDTSEVSQEHIRHLTLFLPLPAIRAAWEKKSLITVKHPFMKENI